MIPRKYEGRPIVLCATGPSLTEEVIKTIEEFKDKVVVFGINDSYKIIDFLDEFYACDTRWWKMHGKEFKEKYPNLSAWTQCQSSAKEFNLQHIKGRHSKAFSESPGIIHFGKNSGFQALNIAYLMGGSKFILTGYNMQKVGDKSHFFGDHPASLNKNSPYNDFVKNFSTIQLEIGRMIVNCTPNSALNIFEKADLRETLCSI